MKIVDLKLEALEYLGLNNNFNDQVVEAMILSHPEDPSSGNFVNKVFKSLIMNRNTSGEILETLMTKDANNNIVSADKLFFEGPPNQFPVEQIEIDFDIINEISEVNTSWFRKQYPDYVNAFYLTNNRTFQLFNNTKSFNPNVLSDIEVGTDHPIWINVCLSEKSNNMCVNMFSGINGLTLMSYTVSSEIVALTVTLLYAFNWWVALKTLALILTLALFVAAIVLAAAAAATAGAGGTAITLGAYLMLNKLVLVAILGLLLAFLNRLLALLREIFASAPNSPQKTQLGQKINAIQTKVTKLEKLEKDMARLKNNAQQQAAYIQKCKEALNEMDASIDEAIAGVKSATQANETIQDPDLKAKIKGALDKIKGKLDNGRKKSKGLKDH